MIGLSLTAALLFLLASGFYSGTEMGLYRANRVRIQLEADHRPRSRAGTLSRLIKNPQETVLAIVLGTNVANYLLTVSAAEVAGRMFTIEPTRADFYVPLMLAPLVFVFGDVVPKNWFQADANRLMMWAAPLLRVTHMVFKWTGVLWLLRSLTRLLLRWTGYRWEEAWTNPRIEVVGLLQEGGAYGALTLEQTRIIDRVMNLANVHVGSIMVPRRKVATIPATVTAEQFRSVVQARPYSRLPVVGKEPRRILGVVTVHHVLADEEGFSIERHLRPPLHVSANTSTAAALLKLQQAEAAMAIVTDPRRGWVGIITLKDVVEEIFGGLAAW